jgi:adenylosuccinate lyase
MNTYESPLNSRYASREMLELFGPDKKFTTWRRLWLALARAERELGLPITREQIDEMAAHLDDVEYGRAAEWEKKLRHDVMAHIHAWGEQCPAAAPVIHLGATSCYVGDNTDILIMRGALALIAARLRTVISRLARFADEYKALPTLGYTHFQPAQMVTVGKRAALWLHDLLMDLDEVERRLSSLKLLGSKGTTGTQASFLELFGGDEDKVRRLEERIAAEMGVSGVYPVTGQTYPRKVDAYVLHTLSGVAQSASKFAADVRLLSHLKEIEEPFESKQVGSSAMPYKRNPMRCERIASLSRVVMGFGAVAEHTAANQWFERTLDDSAGKRVSVPEAFLATDAILNLYASVAGGLTVHPGMIERHIREELPFMASENILMRAVKAGGDRQELHEKIRLHSLEAGRVVKDEGKPNDLLERIAADPAFGLSWNELDALMEPSLYIGCCISQVEAFLRDHVYPRLETAEAVEAVELRV